MPAITPRQQRFFGAALAYKRGDTKDASDSVKRLASSLSESDLRDFAGSVETHEQRRSRLKRGVARKLARGK